MHELSCYVNLMLVHSQVHFHIVFTFSVLFLARAMAKYTFLSRASVMNERTNKRTNQLINKRTNKRTNKSTNEPTNKPTNEPTNEQTKEQIPIPYLKVMEWSDELIRRAMFKCI